MQPEKRPKIDSFHSAKPVMDIRPRLPVTQPLPPVQPTVSPVSEPAPVQPQPIEDTPSHKKPRRKHAKLLIISIILIIIALLGVGAYIGVPMWYQAQLQPVSADKNAARIRITIEPGSTPDQIGKLLFDKKLIRSDVAFVYYTRDQGVQSKLQAGTFSLKPSDSLAVIVEHLVAGKTDEFSLTFLPGETLAGHRQVLIKAGYGEAEVDAALKKKYDHPVFATKPAEADLEGYIFGETYSFTADASPEQVLIRTFDELNEQITKNDLVNAFQKQGLSLYEGITLASIVQKEVATTSDSKQVAQVFFKRLNEGYPLGADATFVYAAKKVGETPSVDFESPYNTRKYQGLPPGPISSPGLQAMLAVAAPAEGDYLYFVSGDDGKTYFSRTLEEHQALTAQYCKKNCSLF